MNELEARVREAVKRIQRQDEKLSAELESVRARASEESPAFEPESMDTRGGTRVAAPLMLESIVLRTGRPVLAIKNDEPNVQIQDADSEVWRARLAEARQRIVPAVQAVGRIDLVNHPSYEWVGTGWLVSKDTILTNRHVAQIFGRASDQRFVFRMGAGGRMAATVDFLREFDRETERRFDLVEISYISDEDGPDLAFLRVEPHDGAQLAEPIRLASRSTTQGQTVAVIGYPARDSRIPEQDLMERIFGNVYDHKRLAPGQLIGTEDGLVLHDCSTLGGNSGSVVLDLATGEALALHFSGRFLEANYAVSSEEIASRLARRVSTGSTPDAAGNGARGSAAQRAGGRALQSPPGSASQTWTVPLRLTIEVGTGQIAGGATRGPVVPARETEDLIFTESAPEDYANREGYDAGFLEADPDVPLPRVIKAAEDVLQFTFAGADETVLNYQHFSVVMSRRRRMCFFSATNLDGRRSRKSTRAGWRLDPRIPKGAQIMKECYGVEPKFSRGHMTRREDPVWGTKQESERGNTDSMHVTNAVPQMQPFNAGIWLGLEDYALQNAREDEMRISVFTGPFLFASDPEYFDVKIPRSFWKVIVFIHDQTEKLCATGYTMSQEAFLGEPEFVFGQYVTPEHKTTQVPIRSIEERAGLSFGPLAALDPLVQVDELPMGLLTDFGQIRFA